MLYEVVRLVLKRTVDSDIICCHYDNLSGFTTWLWRLFPLRLSKHQSMPPTSHSLHSPGPSTDVLKQTTDAPVLKPFTTWNSLFSSFVSFIFSFLLLLRVNQALMFDGVDDHVTLPSIHNLGLTDRCVNSTLMLLSKFSPAFVSSFPFSYPLMIPDHSYFLSALLSVCGYTWQRITPWRSCPLCAARMELCVCTLMTGWYVKAVNDKCRYPKVSTDSNKALSTLGAYKVNVT